MKTALLINGSMVFGSAKGRLNATLQQEARETLESLGYNIKETVIAEGYDIKDEVEKIFSADVIIWQMPAFFMGEPWIVKKYIDEVFTAGAGRFFSSDGRHRTNPTEGYGTGGLMQDKKYMFSVTWNAPIEAFTREHDFFEGVGIEGVYLHLHKGMQFCGMQSLPTFSCNDVIKNPQIEKNLGDYKAHLEKYLG